MNIMGIKKKSVLLYPKVKVIKFSLWDSCWILKEKCKSKLYVTKWLQATSKHYILYLLFSVKISKYN